MGTRVHGVPNAPQLGARGDSAQDLVDFYTKIKGWNLANIPVEPIILSAQKDKEQLKETEQTLVDYARGDIDDLTEQEEQALFRKLERVVCIRISAFYGVLLVPQMENNLRGDIIRVS